MANAQIMLKKLLLKISDKGAIANGYLPYFQHRYIFTRLVINHELNNGINTKQIGCPNSL